MGDSQAIRVQKENFQSCVIASLELAVLCWRAPNTTLLGQLPRLTENYFKHHAFMVESQYYERWHIHTPSSLLAGTRHGGPEGDLFSLRRT